MPPKRSEARRGRGRAVLSNQREVEQSLLEPEPEPEPQTEAQEGGKEARTRSPTPSVASSGKKSESSSPSSESAECQKKKRRRSLERKRKAKEHASLSSAQEDDMFKWLKIHPVLYSRGMSGYKDVQARNKLWADKAEQMGKSVKQLKDIWYKSVWSRVGRLLKKKSGTSQFDVENCSDRDKHLVDKMQFLVPHIHEVKKRPTVSMKQKLTTSHVSADEESDVASVASSQTKTKERPRETPTFSQEDEEEESGTASKGVHHQKFNGNCSHSSTDTKRQNFNPDGKSSSNSLRPPSKI